MRSPHLVSYRPRQSDSQSLSSRPSSVTLALTITTTPIPSSSTTPTTTSQTLFVTAESTSSLSQLTTTSSSDHPSSSTPSTSTSPSSGFVFSTFTSSSVSEINGSPTTIVTPIVTAGLGSSSSRSSSRTAIIAASASAAIAVLIVALTALFCLRKRRRRDRRYWALSRAKRLSTSRPNTLLAGDEMDLPFPSPPFASLDQPNPFTTHNLNRYSSATGSVDSDAVGGGGDSGDGSLPAPFPPRLLRARASDTGSIFQESVWPPPSAASQLMDPLTFPSQSVDLTRVITDVMGPPESSPMLLLQPAPPSREQGQGQGQEQEQGALNTSEEEAEAERRGAIIPPPTIPPSIQADWSPRSELRSTPSPSPSPPIPPRSLLRPRTGSDSESELPLRPPSTPWLTRPLNSSPRGSPKGSPLQRSLPL